MPGTPKRITNVQVLILVQASNTCTYGATRDNYVSQYMFHCLTCNLVGNLGMCASCAIVCHAGHNVPQPTWAAAFFCDCGDLSVKKKGKVCKALVANGDKAVAQ